MPLSMYLPSLMTVFGASFIAFMSPGPNFVGIVSSAVQNRFNGIIVAIGVSLGTTFWAVMAVTGITTVITRYPGAALIMQIVGGCYLTWLGIKSLRSTLKPRSAFVTSVSGVETPFRSFTKGLLIQITNPKTAMFWLSMVSVVILPDTPIIIGVLLVVGTTAIALAWHLLLAVAFSFGRTRDVYLKARIYISIVFGIAFIALGLRLLLWNVIAV
jgi:threonine/homoserine/homoserine lactone efflux protein